MNNEKKKLDPETRVNSKKYFPRRRRKTSKENHQGRK